MNKNYGSNVEGGQQAPTKIIPTVGRVVHFFRNSHAFEDDLPLAAIVAKVIKIKAKTEPDFMRDTKGGEDIFLLNLMVIDEDSGTPYGHPSVRLVQDGDEIPTTDPFCRWMPFQVGQAVALRKADDTAKVGTIGKAAPNNAPVKQAEVVVDFLLGHTPPAFKGTLNEAVKGLKGPHISAEDVNNAIAYVQFYVIGQKTTLCEITLVNGFTVRGEASVLLPANFKLDVGKDLSYQDAWKKIWALEAYALADRIMKSRTILPSEQVR